MIPRFAFCIRAAALVVLLGIGSRQSDAQTASELGAWDGLMLSPVGALAPVTSDPGATAPGVYSVSLRYGRWRYDADDVVHDNVGLTVTRSFGFARTQLSVTIAYGLVECPTCSGWQLGGIDLRSTLWNHASAPASGRPVTAGVALRASLGGARYRGPDAPSVSSAAIALPIEIALPIGKASQLRASILPGLGYGRIASSGFAESGVLPMVGGAVAWNIASAFTIDIGIQRIFIDGGPTQVGAAFSWKFHSHSDAHQ